jgi:transposase
LISVGTVHYYLQRAETAGIKWPLPEGFDDTVWKQPYFGSRPHPCRRGRFRRIMLPSTNSCNYHTSLCKLLWEEYQDTNPDGYRYSRFCELYQRWHRKQDVVLRQKHKPGERMFVDWAGATIPIHNRATDEITQAPLFVAALGASSYTYAKAARTNQIPDAGLSDRSRRHCPGSAGKERSNHFRAFSK